MKRFNTKGFTIVELLISTAVLSIVLVSTSIIVVQIGRMYYKGVVLAKTQDAARNVIDKISRPIQLEGATYLKSTSPIFLSPIKDAKGADAQINAYCVGNQRYSFATDMQVGDPVGGAQNGQIRHAVWRDTVANSGVCNTDGPADIRSDTPSGPGGVPAVDAESMLGAHMRLTKLDINEVSPSSGLYKITVGVLYGDDDLIDLSTDTCKGNVAGGQWCALAQYETVVFKRIKG